MCLVDKVTVEGRCKVIHGDLEVPGDKSISHRAVMLASIALGDSSITGILKGRDVMATINAFQMMGIQVEDFSGGLRVKGKGLMGLREACDVINAQNSGTTLRLLTGLLSGQSFFTVLTGDSSLRNRPMMRVVNPLRTMGAKIWGREDGNRPPLAIKGARLRSINYSLPIASAQVKSALLLAGLYAEGVTELIEPVKTRDHTEKMLRNFGVDIKTKGCKITLDGERKMTGRDLKIPGDISSAAFFVVAALLLPRSEITIRDVGINPTRTGFIDILRRMGAFIEIENVKEWAGEPVGDITVKSSPLKAVSISAEEVPGMIDEFPIICVAASKAEGVTEISGAKELRVKESDRIAVMANELRKFGVLIDEKEDGVIIEGGDMLQGSICDSHGDHRVAMALYVAGLVAKGDTIIEDVGCVETSFPGFFNLMDGVVH